MICLSSLAFSAIVSMNKHTDFFLFLELPSRGIKFLLYSYNMDQFCGHKNLCSIFYYYSFVLIVST